MSGLGVALALLSGTVVQAAEVSLRPDVSITSGQVTLGDLFDGAGGASRVAVAQVTGPSVVLDAGRVQSLARQHGLQWDNAQGVRRIIARAGAPISSAASPTRGNTQVLAYARPINAGELIGPEDLVWTKAVGGPADAPSDPEAIIGKAAKRPLREGSPAAMRDVSAPALIKKDEVIAVAYEADGIRLVLQAKAMQAAALGDSFNAMNPASKKIVQAVATGPGEAVVGPAAAGLRQAQFSTSALR
ncbi:MAG TPA: flagellar basal body P-ring formation chaperone FlgA [Caulobacteraceae bacterium]|jgi:flagella basal body P-ring formation protein FlgA